MTNFLSTLKITAGAAILALGLAAAPAMAQSGEPAAKFSLGIGNGQTELSIQGGGGGENAKGGNFGGGNNNFGGGGNSFNLCLSNRDIIRGIRDYGFRRVEVVDSSRRRAEVIGRWGRFDYLMEVNKCTGEVDILERIRRGNNSGFGLQFNFNN